MSSYCENCDEYLDHSLFKNKENCPDCGNALIHYEYPRMNPRHLLRYFVKKGKVHRYPQPSKCRVYYAGEWLSDDPPEALKRCNRCFVGLPRWFWIELRVRRFFKRNLSFLRRKD